jgi:hypothetical protein
MRKLPEPVKRRVRAQMNANAAELTAMQRRVVPKDDGVLAGTIKAEDQSDETRIRVKVSAGGPATTREVRQDSGKRYDYARAVENGREGQKPQPFFFGSYRALRKRMKAAVNRAARAGIKEALR